VTEGWLVQNPPVRQNNKLSNNHSFITLIPTNVVDPDPENPYVFGHPDPDPLFRDPDPLLRDTDPDPSIIKQN
jgi:hypothetical protein